MTLSTLLTIEEQEDLVTKGLAVKKVNEEKGLVTYKYARKVFYDNLWEKHPNTMECRGHTYCMKTGTLVLAAPRKSFNYLENGWWKDVKDDETVTVYKKVNGFMATVSVHNDEIVIGTTGTTTSDYAKMAREMLEKDKIFGRCLTEETWFTEGCTELFEIVHPDDPHIVEEKIGVHFLGVRYNFNGEFYPSDSQLVGVMTFKAAKMLAYHDRGEGFMVYRSNDGDHKSPCKLKTPYYLGKKALMRVTEKNYDKILVNGVKTGRIDRRWERVVDYIDFMYCNRWIGFSEQERRSVIEEYDDLNDFSETRA